MAAQTVGNAPRTRTAEFVQPLFRLALIKGATSSVLLHIRRGAPVNGRDSRGLTPLMLAATAGRGDICSLLMNEGADNSLTASDDRTASDLASAAGHSHLALELAPRTATATAPELCAFSNTSGVSSDDRNHASGCSDDGWLIFGHTIMVSGSTSAVRENPRIMPISRRSMAHSGMNA